MFDDVHGTNRRFRPGNIFQGSNRGPQSHEDFYDAEHVENWRNNMGWKQPRKKGKKKKNKKKKKSKNKGTDKVAEFYAKLQRKGGGEVRG